MSNGDSISAHYGRSGIAAAIEAGLAAKGLSIDDVSIDDLAVVDEFHVGGRPATAALFDRLGLEAGMRVLDVGSGLGGAARFCAHEHGCTVTGVDLTPQYVEAAETLTRWTGLDDRVTFRCSDGAGLPFEEQTFDAAYLLHVGMNVADKFALFSSVARVLRPGARFGVYDLVLGDAVPGDAVPGGASEPTYPMPWAGDRSTSHLTAPSHYEHALVEAGFEVTSSRARPEVVAGFVRQVRKLQAGKEPPALGLHLVVGETFPEKAANLANALEAELIVPHEFIATRR